jgi:hypothetical protein
MGNYKYITNRVLLNKAGQETGNIAVMVPNGTDMARIRYRCPECSHTHQGEIEWKRPFSVKCSGCGVVIKLPRLKDEIKKEKKLARA